MNQYIRDFREQSYSTHIWDEPSELVGILNNEGFRVIHMTIRSMRRNFDQFKLMLVEFADKFDCIILTETWKIECMSLYTLDGFEVVYTNGDLNQNDGVIAYIRNGISHSPKIVNIGCCKSIQLKIKTNAGNSLITAMYRPPSTSPWVFNEDLNEYLENCSVGIVNYHLLVGDMNINLFSDEDFAQDYLNILCKHNFVSYINSNTRVQGSSSSCIDHIFLKTSVTSGTATEAGILRSDITDHYSIIVQFGTKEKQENIYSKIVSKKSINYGSLKEELGNVCWEEVCNEEDIEVAAQRS